MAEAKQEPEGTGRRRAAAETHLGVAGPEQPVYDREAELERPLEAEWQQGAGGAGQAGPAAGAGARPQASLAGAPW